MQLHQLRPKIKVKNPKRIGRGSGSGHGKTATRGNKGAGQRKGRLHYIGHEGGNIPYLRKIPKRGFSAVRPKIFQIVNLEDIVRTLKGEKEINPEKLKNAGLIKTIQKPVKILASLKNKVDWKATFRAHRFSKAAREIIETAGGKIECLNQ